MADDAWTGIVAREGRLDAQLPRPRLVGPPPRELTGASDAWAAAVWAQASLDGPIAPDPAAVEWALEVGRHPVFICGAHRSGTTLVRDLLDDHPALSVLPSEGTFLTSLRARLADGPPGEALGTMGREWVRRLANPINRPPYWLLGRSGAGGSPYVAFARRLQGWWPVVAQRAGSAGTTWPLLAVALAYASGRQDSAGRAVRRWVEKTPTNERFLDLLWSEFPAAKIVQVVRDPTSVVASRKQIEQAAGGAFRSLDAVLRDLAVTYRVAAAQAHDTSGRYCLVRYEELTADPAPTLDRLAAFLEIAPSPSLFQPTVAGLPAANNSAFQAAAAGRIQAAAPAPAGSLTAGERLRLAAAVGRLAAEVGYPLAPVSRWRSWFVHATRPFR